MAVLGLCACGGRAEDTTILSAPPDVAEAPEPPRSAALEALAEPAARDAFCGWVGASAASVAGAALDCTQLVERCRTAASNVPLAEPGNAALALFGAPENLAGVLGCPATFETLDACLGQLIEWTVARYPDGPGCGMTAPIQPPGLADLSMMPSCIGLALECPQLLQQLLATRGLGG